MNETPHKETLDSALQQHSDGEKQPPQNAQLQRTIGLPGGVALIVGSIIGSGIFVSPTYVLVRTQSVGMALTVWTLGGLFSTIGCLCFLEIGLMFPLSGAEYCYLHEGLGALPAFLYVWSSVFVIRPAGNAALTYAFALYVLQPFYPGGEGEIPTVALKVLASLVIVLLGVINSASVKWATRIQIVFTVIKVFAIIMIVITGIVRLSQGFTESFENAFDGTTPYLGEIGFAFYYCLFSYSGWNQLNYVTEELKKPERNLPRAGMISLLTVTSLYVSVNVAYLACLSPQDMIKSGAVAVTLGSNLYGVMSWVMPVFVACSVFGCCNGGILAKCRVIFAAARNGHLPQILALVHTEWHTPVPAIAFDSLISIIMLIPESSDFDSLVTNLSIAYWLFVGVMIAVAIIYLRVRKPNLSRPYKNWIIIPIIYLLFSIYLVVAPFTASPISSSLALLFVLAGAPIYYALIVKNILPLGFQKKFTQFTEWTQKRFHLAPPHTADATDGPDDVTLVTSEKMTNWISGL